MVPYGSYAHVCDGMGMKWTERELKEDGVRLARPARSAPSAAAAQKTCGHRQCSLAEEPFVVGDFKDRRLVRLLTTMAILDG